MSVLTRRAGEVFGARVEQGVRMQGGRGQVADALVVFRESIEASRDVHAPIGVTSAHREPDEPRARRWLLDEKTLMGSRLVVRGCQKSEGGVRVTLRIDEPRFGPAQRAVTKPAPRRG